MYELCPDFLVPRAKVDSLPVDIKLIKFVAKLMEYKYESYEEAKKHLSNFSLAGRGYFWDKSLAKPLYPIAFREALYGKILKTMYVLQQN